MERVPADLAALAVRMVDRFRPDAENRQVQLVFNDQTGGSLQPVQVDPGRIEQIISNLLTNALRHTPAGGSISVILCRKGENAVLSVADTGPGIAEEALPRIFERFYRADKARSRDSGGVGLGLAIARQLALAHGGDLTAFNRPGSGAEFTLVLPAA
jgi:two-component system sensor histidine kinase BaeS